jgi:hypothetical protein
MSEFATWLRRAMRKRKMNNSDVARALWGTIKDSRGYDVARMRDRIGHYLRGSFPDGPNLVRIGKVFRTDPLELFYLAPTPRVHKMRRRR